MARSSSSLLLGAASPGSLLACGRRALDRVARYCLPHEYAERAAAWRTFYATGAILRSIRARASKIGTGS